MSNQTRQGVPEFVPIGSVESDRRKALMALLAEVNDTLAYLEDDCFGMTSGIVFNRLDAAYEKFCEAWGLP